MRRSIRLRRTYVGLLALGICMSLQGCSEPAPSSESVSTEAPSTEAPSTEAPSTEAPSTEAPSARAPSSEGPSTAGPPVQARDAAPDQVTTVILVRHAEKQDGEDPALTSEGRRRAAQLAHVLSEGGVDAIYASQFRRTQETAEVVASTVGLEIVVVDARDIEGLANRLRAEHAGETVVVVSHSNIVPEVIRALGADAGDIPEDEYDDLFLVVLNGTTGGVSALHLNYGSPSGGG